MNPLHEFIVDDTVTGGLWSELLDALAAVPACRLSIEAFWQPEDPKTPLVLPPRTSPLPFTDITYTYPFMEDPRTGGVVRRSLGTFALEEHNLRVIAEASAQVLEVVALPGELFVRVMRTPVSWDALREVYLTGLWPLVEVSELVSASQKAIVVAPASASTAEVVLSLTSGEDPPPGVTKPSSKLASPSFAEVARDDVNKSLIIPDDGSTLAASKEAILVAPGLTTSFPESAEDKPSEETVAVPSSSQHPKSRPLPPKHTTPSLAPPVSNTHDLPLSSSSPMSSLLEAMPNLRILSLKLNRFVSDAVVHPSITTLDSPPRSPHSFLRNLTQFEATSLSNDDRTLAFLPAQLEVLSLQRHPFLPRTNMCQTATTPMALLEMFEKAHFPDLKSLRLWYIMQSPDDLISEKVLLSRLPKMFPLLEILELCRVWDYDMPSLAGLWDPIPLARKLISEFKHLRVFKFDPDTRERHGRFPFPRPSKALRQYLVQLHGIAEQIVADAPWLKTIALYLEYGSREDSFWEDWGVVAVPGEKVALNRPPPKVIDSHY